MRKRLVTRSLERAGCVKVSDDGIHEKWACPTGDHTTALPRHNEISAGVLRNLVRDLLCLPKGWLQ